MGPAVRWSLKKKWSFNNNVRCCWVKISANFVELQLYIPEAFGYSFGYSLISGNRSKTA